MKAKQLKTKNMNYANLLNSILEKKIKDFMRKGGMTIGSIAMYLQCSESYVKEIMSGNIPSLNWLSHANPMLRFAIMKHKEKKTKDKRQLISEEVIDAIKNGLLREYREEHKLTQNELGRLIGISRREIIKIEKYNYIPRGCAIKRIREKCTFLTP